MKKFIVLAALLIGCDTPHEMANQFAYAKDERTGMCFAMWGMGGNGGSFSYVPCTANVEEQIRLTNLKPAGRK